ncbi:MAG: hypothetical protein JO141_29570 [Bradyrhizobium sp.]|nr:hypothetical protein [Bradyrhizobium sp.]
MLLGLSLSAFTTLHVAISLIAIVAGLIVMFGMLGPYHSGAMAGIFLLFTILTSVTGFMFPFSGVTPGIVLGIISCVLLAIACLALYGMKASGIWRGIYAVTALLSLYLNVFVLGVQSFLKIPPLHELAPGNPPAELAFAVVQGIVLLFFIGMILQVWRRYKPA